VISVIPFKFVEKYLKEIKMATTDITKYDYYLARVLQGLLANPAIKVAEISVCPKADDCREYSVRELVSHAIYIVNVAQAEIIPPDLPPIDD
jgi:hypothetical protein